MEKLKHELLQESLQCNALLFGSFSLKSGRQSPYFFNSGNLCTGRSLSLLANAYAETVISTGVDYDVIFGPAYKGISLAALTAAKLYEKTGRSCGYAYNRKEAKSHGEGGNLVGTDMRDKRVFILDDVLTAGTALREAVSFLEPINAQLVGVVLILDRQERGSQGTTSAVGDFKRQYGIPVKSIITVSDIIEYSKGENNAGDAAAIAAYKQQYQASD